MSSFPQGLWSTSPALSLPAGIRQTGEVSLSWCRAYLGQWHQQAEIREVPLKLSSNSWDTSEVPENLFFIPFFLGPSSFLCAHGNIPNRIFHSRNISFYLSLVRSSLLPPQVHMCPDTATTPFSCISLQIMSQSVYFLQYGRTKDKTRGEDLWIRLF